MKTKSLDNKINAFIQKIESLRKKGIKEQTEGVKEAFKVLETELDSTLRLQNEVQSLKTSLRDKKKDLETGIKKLQKSSDAIKIARKKEKSVYKASRTEKVTPKPAELETPVSSKNKKKNAKPGKKMAKSKSRLSAK
jgi:septation ring formation regulator EzrA